VIIISYEVIRWKLRQVVGNEELFEEKNVYRKQRLHVLSSRQIRSRA